MPRRLPLGIVALLISLPALGIFGHSSGLLDREGWGVAHLMASSESAEELFRRGVERFDQQRYREAFELLEAATERQVEADPRELAFYREAAGLRYAGMNHRSDDARLHGLELLRLAETQLDDWGARALRELVRAGRGNEGEVTRLYERTLQHWESHEDVARAVEEYIELLTVTLDQNAGPGGYVLRMWEKLVAIEAPRDRLIALGARILGATSQVGEPEPIRIQRRVLPPSVGQTPEAVPAVARDLLRMEPPGWLAAIAHLRLGERAERAGRFREALRHYDLAARAASPHESEAGAEAALAAQRLRAPEVDLSSDALLRPGSHVFLSLRWRNLESWKLELRRVGLDEFGTGRLKEPSWELADYLPWGAGTLVRTLEHADDEELRSREPDSLEEPHRRRSRQELLEPLEPGLYLLELQGRPAEAEQEAPRSRTVLQVTRLGLVTQAIGGAGEAPQVELWAVDMESGEPLAELDLIAHLGWRQERRSWDWTREELRTDRDGLARLRMVSTRGPMGLVLGERRGHPLVSLAHLPGRSDARLGMARQAFVLSDRPLYRPGETVHLVAFVRDRDPQQRRAASPVGLRVQLRIDAPDGSRFHEAEVALDENGSLEATLELPVRPALGAYSVRLFDIAESRWVGHASFRVEEYRLPEFVVSVGLDDAKRYVLGDTLRVDVEAEYLFGGPVEGMAEVVVTRRPHWVFYQPYRRFGWLYDDTGGRGGFHYGGDEEVLRKTLPLDENGVARIEIPTLVQEHDARDWNYTVEARVTDSSRREERGASTVPLTHQELYAWLSPQRAVVPPGGEARVQLRVEDAQHRPAALAGRWSVQRMGKDGAWQDVLDRLAETDASGELLLSFEAERAGYYTLRYRSRDARGNPVEAETSIWCADPRTTTVTHAAGGLQLIAESEGFPGEIARVLLVSEVAGVPVHLTRGVAGSVQTELLRMKGTVQLLEIPLTRAHRPYFWLRAAQARDWLLQEATLKVVAPMAEEMLTVDVAFEREAYTPGETATLKVTARDALGHPVRTPLTLAVVDEAVLALVPRVGYDPTPLFQRYETPRLGSMILSAGRFGGFRFREPAEVEDDEIELGAVLEEEAVARQAGVVSRGGELYVRGGRSGEVSLRMEGVDAASAMPMAAEKSAMADAVVDPMGGGAEPMAPTTVRSDFRTTVLWRTAVMTDDDGVATVEVPLAESLTSWEALAVALGPDARAGAGTGSTRTRKDVMVRLNHPRVFRELDRFLFASTVHNETDASVDALVTLEAEGLAVEGAPQRVSVPAHGQARVEWWAAVEEGAAPLDIRLDEESRSIQVRPGSVLVRVTAESPVDSDAFERRVLLHPFGTPTRVVAAGEATAGVTRLRFTLPNDRLMHAQMATLALSPSVLSACLEALPYLADYPYGCTEQTLSRFVPAVAVRAAAEALGVRSRRIDPELDDKIGDGLQRVLDFQHGDGGWGWWKEDESSAYMTAHVLVALARARDAGVSVDRDPLHRGRDWLRSVLPGLERQHDDLAYALFALSEADRTLDRARPLGADETALRYARTLFERRDGLRDYARALLAIVLHRGGLADEARLTLAQLHSTAVEDDEYGLVHWGRRSGYWWRGEGAVESTAFALMAYGEIDPSHENQRRAARWLVANRSGHRWDSTRASAHAIYALVDFAGRSGELESRFTVVARLAGQEVARLSIEPEDLIDGGGRFPLPVELLHDGSNEVELTMEGSGRCYATVAYDGFTRQRRPEPTAFFLDVTRELIRLRPLRTLGGSILQIEEPLADGDAVASGDRIRVRLRVKAHHDLEYVAIEDPRPAGCEPVEILSGWQRSGGLGVRREVRDEKTAFFASMLAEGEHVIEYELRAESPGVYQVGPARVWGMYLPDVSGSSSAFGVEISPED